MYSKHFLVIASCAIACVLARPSDIPPEQLQPTVIPIVSQSEELEPDGTYKFSYETGNGIKREETAYEKVVPKSREASSNEGGESDDGSNEIHVQQGSFSYTAPDGTVITLRYIADENGFQPIGDHLPRAPVLGSAVSTSAQKSGRALKTTDSVESASVPVEVKAVEKQTEPALLTPEEVKVAPEPITLEEVKVASEPITSEEVKVASEPITSEEVKVAPVSITPEEVKVAPVSITEESNIPSSEVVLSATEPEANGVANVDVSNEVVNVDVSNEVASTVAPAQPITESEQVSQALAEQITTAPEQTVAAEVTESSYSTSAPEESSSAEINGQSTATEALNESPAEETEQPSTNAPQSASVEESSSTTDSA